MTQHLAELGRHALEQYLAEVIGEVILGQVDALAAEHRVGHPADADDDAHGTPQHVKVELASVQRDTCRLFVSGDVISSQSSARRCSRCRPRLRPSCRRWCL